MIGGYEAPPLLGPMPCGAMYMVRRALGIVLIMPGGPASPAVVMMHDCPDRISLCSARVTGGREGGGRGRLCCFALKLDSRCTKLLNSHPTPFPGAKIFFLIARLAEYTMQCRMGCLPSRRLVNCAAIC